MARPIPCDLDQVETSTWMIGNLTNGDQTALCDNCMVLWMLGKLDEVLDAEAKAKVVSVWTPTPEPAPAAEDLDGDAPKRRPGGRRRAQHPGADADGPTGPITAETAATAAQEAEPNRGVAEAPAPDHDS